MLGKSESAAFSMFCSAGKFCADLRRSNIPDWDVYLVIGCFVLATSIGSIFTPMSDLRSDGLCEFVETERHCRSPALCCVVTVGKAAGSAVISKLEKPGNALRSTFMRISDEESIYSFHASPELQNLWCFAVHSGVMAALIISILFSRIFCRNFYRFLSCSAYLFFLVFPVLFLGVRNSMEAEDKGQLGASAKQFGTRMPAIKEAFNIGLNSCVHHYHS